MITKQEAIRIAEDHVNSGRSGPFTGDERRYVDDEWTIEREYGWMFMYNTAEYIRTRDRRHALVGNAPLLILRDGVTILQFPSSFDREKALAEYEANPEKCLQEYGETRQPRSG